MFLAKFGGMMVNGVMCARTRRTPLQIVCFHRAERPNGLGENPGGAIGMVFLNLLVRHFLPKVCACHVDFYRSLSEMRYVVVA